MRALPGGFLDPRRARLRAERAPGDQGLALATPPERADLTVRNPIAKALSTGVMVAHPGRMSDEAVLAAGEALRGAVGFDETLDSFTGLMPPAPPKTPITIAWGEHDRLLLRRQAVRAAKWSGQRVKLLKGCGHVPMSDDPELIARVLLEASAL
nr:hypothetical protein GCM10020093_086840 [Planobispora longispora]